MKTGVIVRAALAAVLLSGCGDKRFEIPEDARVAPQPVAQPVPQPMQSFVVPQSNLPPMQWDFRPDAAQLTTAALNALSSHGSSLPASTPADIGEWCPAYPSASQEDRAAFWSGFLSTLARFESTWNPSAIGGDNQWFGLTQISPGTARGYGCLAQSGQALLNGPANLSCAVRIMAVTVPRDGVVSAGRAGVAADWAPLLDPSKERAMKSYTSSQPYCQ